MEQFLLNLISNTISQVWVTLQHNWPFLLASALIATWLQRSVNAELVGNYLRKHRRSSVVTATVAAVATPLCSCGTTAVVLGMMASLMPWAPIVAFMVASPLTSPQELFYSAGLFGWPFALTFFLASILLGLAAGAITTALENMGFLANQIRIAQPVNSCACSEHPQPVLIPQAVTASVCGCQAAGIALPLHPVALAPQACCEVVPLPAAVTLPPAAQSAPMLSVWLDFGEQFLRTGLRLLVLFLGYASIGYFLNGLIPAQWIAALFGSGRIYSVPLAATLGLPFYFNTEASLPLVRALLDAGMSPGAALAFMISGAGTSFGAVAGALTIARWRVVGLVVGLLWGGAILSGFAYDLLLTLGLF